MSASAAASSAALTRAAEAAMRTAETDMIRVFIYAPFGLDRLARFCGVKHVSGLIFVNPGREMGGSCAGIMLRCRETVWSPCADLSSIRLPAIPGAQSVANIATTAAAITAVAI